MLFVGFCRAPFCCLTVGRGRERGGEGGREGNQKVCMTFDCRRGASFLCFRICFFNPFFSHVDTWRLVSCI